MADRDEVRNGIDMLGFGNVVVLAVATLTIAACGGDGDDSSGDGSTIRVRASSFVFEPAEIEIAAGEEVTVELTSTDIEHDFVVEGSAIPVAHAEAGDTDDGTLRIDEPGAHTFYCSIPGHRAAGMEGRLVVTD